MKKRILYFIGICISMFVGVVSSFFIANTTFGSSEWYSNSPQVGYWDSQPLIYVTNLSSSLSANSYVSSAKNKWYNAGIDVNITTSPSMAAITFYSGTRSQLNAYGFTYTSSIDGQTKITSTGSVDSDTYHSYIEITGAKASMRVDYNTSGLTNVSSGTVYLHLAMHEIGHALGWYGHNRYGNTANNVMYEYNNAVTTLQFSDYRQLLLAYDYIY